MDDADLRAAIVAAGARLGARGLIAAGEGNLSVRVAVDRLLVTPSGWRKDELTPDDVLSVPLERPDGGDPEAAAGRRPTSDIAIHRAILRRHGDVMAVAHAHLPASMALTLAGERPDPLALPETAHFLPVLPVVAFGAMGSDELAARIADGLGGEPAAGAAILERHGAVAVGRGAPRDALRQAVDRLELVDVLCRVWRDALLVRAARRMLGDEAPG